MSWCLRFLIQPLCLTPIGLSQPRQIMKPYTNPTHRFAQNARANKILEDQLDRQLNVARIVGL